MTYEDAFCLRDNPFCPSRPFLNINDPRFRRRLSSSPLRLHEEPRLDKLYCDGLDDARNLSDFLRLVEDRGFRPNPPELGTDALAFVVHGAKGVGKTTLVNRMLQHLRTCEPPGDEPTQKWKLYGEWDEESMTKESQLAKIDGMARQIAEEKPAYACIVFDDLIAGAEGPAANLFLSASKNSVVFAFLVTSDPELARKQWTHSKLDPHVYALRQLTPEGAVRYVGERLKVFRLDPAPRVVPPLFPFDETDIRAALTQQSVGLDATVSEIATMRVFNRALCTALRREKERVSVQDGMIRLASAYRDGLDDAA
jgi:hypothetical protein